MKHKRTFVCWGQKGGKPIADGYVLQSAEEDEKALAERIARRSGFAAANTEPAGFEQRHSDGKIIRADFQVTLGTRCRQGGYDVEGRVWIGIHR